MTKSVDKRRNRTAYTRLRARMIAYGQWHPWTAAGPVREAVADRVDAGVPYRWIAYRAGLRPSVVRYLLKADPPARHLRPATAEALLGALGPMVTPVGAMRRLQALAALGHSLQVLAQRMRADPDHVQNVAAGRAEAGVSLCGRIEAVYCELWDQAPPEATCGEKVAATKARRRAAREGWAPPAAWDDDEIDDQRVPTPAGWQRGRRTSAAVAEEYAELATRHDMRVLAPEVVRGDIAERLGVTRNYLDIALSRAARKTAA